MTVPASVTVLVPVYNGTPFVEQAVASVLRQSCANWRLRLVDDASTDESVRVLETFRDPRISVRRHERNLGLYGTLRNEIATLTTEWVVVLMQDDWLEPNYLEVMLATAAQFPDADGLWATEHIIDANGARIKEGHHTRRVERLQPGVESWKSVLRRGCIWTIGGSMTRTRVFRDRSFRIDLPHRGDYEWFLAAIRSRVFVYVEQALLNLRRHALQASTTNLERAQDVIETYAVLGEQFAAHRDDLGWRDRFAVAGRQSFRTARRVPGSLWRGRWKATGRLVTYSCRFLALGIERRPALRTAPIADAKPRVE